MSEPRQCFWYDRQTGCECHAIVEAGRAVQDDGLDVDRLAEAMEACGLGLYHATEPRMLLEQSLPTLVAEYARLRAAPPLPEPEDARDGG